MTGEGPSSRLDGVGMLDGVAHADVTLVVDHAVPGRAEPRAVQDAWWTTARRGVFQGKIIVRPHAQKTDGKMMSRRCSSPRTRR